MKLSPYGAYTTYRELKGLILPNNYCKNIFSQLVCMIN